MSIIHDALKKLQGSTKQLKDPGPQPVLASSPPTEVSGPIFTILTVILSVAALILMLILWNLAKETTRPASPLSLTADQMMPVQSELIRKVA